MMLHFWWNVSKNFETGTRMRMKNLLSFQPNQISHHRSSNHGNPINVNMAATTETIGTEITIVQTTGATITIGIMIIIVLMEITDKTTIDHTIGISDVMGTATVMDHRIINIKVLKQVHQHYKIN